MFSMGGLVGPTVKVGVVGTGVVTDGANIDEMIPRLEALEHRETWRVFTSFISDAGLVLLLDRIP